MKSNHRAPTTSNQKRDIRQFVYPKLQTPREMQKIYLRLLSECYIGYDYGSALEIRSICRMQTCVIKLTKASEKYGKGGISLAPVNTIGCVSLVLAIGHT
jgi:hypothetical protein